MIFRAQDIISRKNGEKMENDRGSAVIKDDGYTLQIVIPVRKDIVHMIAAFIMCVWLAGWLFGEISAIGVVLDFGPFAGSDEALQVTFGMFIGLWLILWTLAGIVVFAFAVWFFFGKYIIVLSQGTLTLTKQALIFKREKHYSTGRIKDMRLRLYASAPYSDVYKHRRRSPQSDTLSFSYGNKMVNFAAGIDDSEARYLLSLFHKKGIHTDENFLSTDDQ